MPVKKFFPNNVGGRCASSAMEYKNSAINFSAKRTDLANNSSAESFFCLVGAAGYVQSRFSVFKTVCNSLVGLPRKKAEDRGMYALNKDIARENADFCNCGNCVCFAIAEYNRNNVFPSSFVNFLRKYALAALSKAKIF